MNHHSMYNVQIRLGAGMMDDNMYANQTNLQLQPEGRSPDRNNRQLRRIKQIHQTQKQQTRHRAAKSGP